MKSCKTLFFLLLTAMGATAQESSTLSKVNLFMGTADDYGQMAPGATVPFGMIQVCPDSNPRQHPGYDYEKPLISGISLNRLSGVGGNGCGGNVALIPGKVDQEIRIERKEFTAIGYGRKCWTASYIIIAAVGWIRRGCEVGVYALECNVVIIQRNRMLVLINNDIIECWIYDVLTSAFPSDDIRYASFYLIYRIKAVYDKAITHYIHGLRLSNISAFERATSQFYVEGQADCLPSTILPIGTRAKSNIYCLSMIIINQIIIISIGIHDKGRFCGEVCNIGSIFFAILDADNLKRIGCLLFKSFYGERAGCIVNSNGFIPIIHSCGNV